MPPIPFADNFLAGSLITLLIPVSLVIALTIWYNLAARRVPADTPESSSALPAPEVVAAADPAAVAEITPVEPSRGPVEPSPGPVEPSPGPVERPIDQP